MEGLSPLCAGVLKAKEMIISNYSVLSSTYRKRGHATHSTAKLSVTIFSNTKLREILEFSVYFPSTPSKLKIQVLCYYF